MIWESHIPDRCDLHWLSTKFYLYFKFFLPSLFYNDYYNFFKFWDTTKKHTLSTFNISPNSTKNRYFNRRGKLLRNYHIGLTGGDVQLISIMNFYIYSCNNQTFVFIIYIDNRKIEKLFEDHEKLSKERALVAKNIKIEKIPSFIKENVNTLSFNIFKLAKKKNYFMY